MCNVTMLFNIFMDGCVREMKAGVGNVGARMKLSGVSSFVVVSK